jgi:hypothetical protein
MTPSLQDIGIIIPNNDVFIIAASGIIHNGNC